MLVASEGREVELAHTSNVPAQPPLSVALHLVRPHNPALTFDACINSNLPKHAAST